MTTEYRATTPQVEDLTPVPGHTGSPTQQYQQQVGKVHAVAFVDGLVQMGSVCGDALAPPTDRLFADVPTEERCTACDEYVNETPV